MSHVDEGVLQALLDGELASEERARLERHLEGCGQCRDELELLRAASLQLGAALERLDHAAPLVSETTLRAVRRRAVRGSARTAWAVPRAAALVLGFAAAASAAVPGSPVRAWVEELLEREPQAVALSSEAEAPQAAEAVAEAGVSVLPADGSVQVVLRGAAPELRIRAVLTGEGRAGVYASGEAASARFSTGAGRIEVHGAGAGELRVELPRGTGNATVIVNGRPYLEKAGSELRLLVPVEDSTDTEISFRVQR